MAMERLDIQPEKLRWAIQRAGASEEMAVESFPMLSEWLSQEKRPTLRQLKNFATKFHVPLGYLFLSDMPEESIPIPMFRGEAGQQDHFDLNVYETVMNVQARQEWLEEYLEENDIDTCEFIGTINTLTPISEAVSRLRANLKLAKRVGTDKTYISRIEKGVIEPGVGMFFRIIDALGLKVDIVRQIM